MVATTVHCALRKQPCISQSKIGLRLEIIINFINDGSTDIANKKRMTILACIIEPENCKPVTIFLRDDEYDSVSGERLENEIIRDFRLRNIQMRLVLGFGSDWASVMTVLVADSKIRITDEG